MPFILAPGRLNPKRAIRLNRAAKIDTGGIGRYDPAADLIFQTMTTTPTEARKSLINATVISLKAAGVWDALDTLWVLAAADAQAARLNWITPGVNNASSANSPTFTADRGYAGDGSTARLTGPVMTTLIKFTQNSGHIGAWVNTDMEEANGDIGTGNVFIRSRVATNSFASRLNDSTTTTTAGAATSIGHTLTSRAGSGSYELYKDAAAVATISVVSAAVAALTFNLCATSATAASTKIVSAGSIGSNLTAAQVASMHSALLSYMQAVGAA